MSKPERIWITKKSLEDVLVLQEAGIKGHLDIGDADNNSVAFIPETLLQDPAFLAENNLCRVEKRSKPLPCYGCAHEGDCDRDYRNESCFILNCCFEIKKNGGFGPTHNGSKYCESGSIASGGKIAHCSCDICF